MHRHIGFPARRRVFVAAMGLALLIGSGTGAADLGTPAIPEDAGTEASTSQPVTGQSGSDEATAGAGTTDDGTTHDGTTHDGTTHDGTTHDGTTHDGTTHDGTTHDGTTHESNAPTKLTCSDIDPTWSEVSLKGHPLSGHYEVMDAHRSIEFFVHDAPAGGKLLNWKSDAPISAVILRSGQDAATYEYEPPATTATGLRPPLVDREGRNLAAVLACYQPDAVDVGIDIYLADTSDPVEVGTQFTYVIEISASGFLNGSSLALELAPQVTAVDVGDCTVSGQQISCAPPLDETTTWTTTITVEATDAGTAVSWVHLQANGDTEPVSASALEVTRLVDERGHGGGCGGHDDHASAGDSTDGQDDHTSGGTHDEGDCGNDQHGMIAACTAIDPAAETLVLRGPFSSRRYQVEGSGNTVIHVEIGETTGAQMATWRSNVPVDGALARTGQQVEVYEYPPATFEGSGVVGPVSGSGPRPMADIGFCVVDRPTVDLSVSIDSVPTIPLSGTRNATATITNDGYAEALGAALEIGPNAIFTLRRCGAHEATDGVCELDPIPAGDSLQLNLALHGTAVGSETLTIVVSAENEGPAYLQNNTDSDQITVERRSSGGTRYVPDSLTPSGEPTFDPPPIVLSAEAEAETVTSEPDSATIAEEADVAPPGPVTPDLTALPFTGPTRFGALTALGVWMLAAGSMLLAGVELLDHPIRGGHREGRSGRT